MLTLNRPDSLNSQTPVMWRELSLAVDCAQRDRARCVIVQGAGRAFSSGFDATAMAELAAPLDDPESREKRRRDGMEWTRGFSDLSRAPFVSIAAIHGYALGAGLELALACDFRITTDIAQLGLIGLQYGIVPDTGAAFWLPRLVGLNKARELLFTAATVTGEQAAAIGLVNQAVPEDALAGAADELAQSIAAHPSVAIRAAKRILSFGADHTFDESLSHAQWEQVECYSSAEFRELAKTFGEQR